MPFCKPATLDILKELVKPRFQYLRFLLSEAGAGPRNVYFNSFLEMPCKV